MLDDFDMDFPEEDEDSEEESSSSPITGNRTFMLIAGGLGALIIIGLIFVAVYMFVIRPRTAAPTIPPTHTLPPTFTATVPATSTPTQAPTDTPEPTSTEAVIPQDDGTGGGPTPDPRTATVEALLTQAALAQTQAAAQLLTQSPTPTVTATGLPDTGFADDVGAPTMLAMAGLLILVIFIARRLRAATA